MESDIPEQEQFLSCLWFSMTRNKRGNFEYQVEFLDFLTPLVGIIASTRRWAVSTLKWKVALSLISQTGILLMCHRNNLFSCTSPHPFDTLDMCQKKSEAIRILSYIRRSHVEMSLHYQDSHVKKNRLIVSIANLTMLMEPLDILSPHLFLWCLSRRQLQVSFQALGSPVYVY